MRMIFHGHLRHLYGESIEMQTETVADAIEGFSRQNDNWPRQMLIDAVGFDTIDKLKTAAAEVHLVPSMYGGGGKFGTILLGAAMIAGAIIFAPAAGVFASSLATSIFVSGALMIAQGIMGLFLKSPKMGKSEDPEASKYLGINKNTTAVGTKITNAWGTIDLTGHWLSLQSDSTNLSFGVFPTNPT